MKRKFQIYHTIFGIAIVLLLGCLVAFPLAADQSLYAVGGDMIIKKGALLYRDFIEPKGPLIYYLNGFSLLLFGHHEWAPRLLDFFFHCICLFFFYRFILKIFESQSLALLTVLLYTILYLSCGYSQTTEPESFALFPMLLIANVLYGFEKKENIQKKDYLLNGFFIGFGTIILFLLKYTLIAPFFASIFFLLFYSRHSLKQRTAVIFSCIVWSLLFFGLFLFFLRQTGSWNNFILMLDYLRHYAELNPFLSKDTIKKLYYQLFPASIVVTFTPTIIFLTSIGISEMRRRIRIYSNVLANPEYVFFAIVIIGLCFGLLSVLFERKFFVYHFERTFWCIAPLSAFGILKLKTLTSVQWVDVFHIGFFKKILVPSLIFFIMVLYSPLARIVYHPLRWAWVAITHNVAMEDKILDDDTYHATEMGYVADYISKHSQPEDQAFLWVYSVRLYFLIDKVPPTICLANLHFVAPWVSADWKKKVIEQLTTSSPLFFVSEYNDANPSISGTRLDSYESLLHWEELKSYLFSHYTLKDSTGHFKIYSRIQ